MWSWPPQSPAHSGAVWIGGWILTDLRLGRRLPQREKGAQGDQAGAGTGPGKSRGLREWKHRQQGGAAGDLEGWCPHSFVALTWAGSPPSPGHAHFGERHPVALLLVGQGVQERERVLPRPLGPARPLPCLLSPLQMRRCSPLHLHTMRHVGFSSPTGDQTPAPFSGSTESFFNF